MKLSATCILLFSVVKAVQASTVDDESNSHLHPKQTTSDRTHLRSLVSNAGPKTFTDGVCIQFCADYFTKCDTYNIFLNPGFEDSEPPSVSGERNDWWIRDGRRERRDRNLQDNDVEVDLGRPYGNHRIHDGAAGGPLQREVALLKCHKSCMQMPRGINPQTYHKYADHPEAVGKLQSTNDNFIQDSNQGGDTIWCRQAHLNRTKSMADAAFHCPHAGNPSAHICHDSYVSIGADTVSPYEHLRDGESTRHHSFFCDIAKDETVADCDNQMITDDNFEDALAMLPDTIEIIFMNGNDGITKLGANVVADNLQNPEILQALYFNDCAIDTVHEDALRGLPALKIFNADENWVSEIPETLFDENTELLQFSMFANPIIAVPEFLFRNTKKIQAIVLYESLISEFAPRTFEGLTKLEILSVVATFKLHDGSFPDGLFRDLVSLEYFDFFGSKFTTVKKSWFEGGWGANIRRLTLWLNDITTIEEGAFDTLESLDLVYFHGNPLDENALEELRKLDVSTLTVGHP